jgi:hypothetical protein
MPLREVKISKDDSSSSRSPSPERRPPGKIRFDGEMAKAKAEVFTKRGEKLNERLQGLSATRDYVIEFCTQETYINKFKDAIKKGIFGEFTRENCESALYFYNAMRDVYDGKASTYNGQRERLRSELDAHTQNIQKHNEVLEEKGSTEWYNNHKAAEYSYGTRLPAQLPDWPSADELVQETTLQYEAEAKHTQH